METLIKEASMESFKKALKIAKIPAWLGFDILAGSAAGGLYGSIKNRKLRKEIFEENVSKDLVDSKSFVKKHAPSAEVLTSRKEIDDGDFTKFEKFQLKSLIPEDGGPINISYNPTTTGKHLIVAPKIANRNLLSHEIGHMIDIAEKPITIEEQIPLFSSDIGYLTGKELRREQDAWTKGPAKDSDSKKEIEAKTIKTYEDAQKYGRRGAAIVGGLGAFSAASPLIMKALLKAKGH